MRTVLDLFSGIGGFALAVRRSGYGRVVGYCELDPFCRAVLAARIAEGRLDDAPIQNDVRELDPLAFRGIDLITGGFPCQDVSAAGKGAGIGGERSGLWFEMARIIAGILPPRLLIENVPALRTRGADRVLADLEALGYDAWPLVVGAWAVGAPHRRERVWIVGRRYARLAHADPEPGATQYERERQGSNEPDGTGARLANADGAAARDRGTHGDEPNHRRNPAGTRTPGLQPQREADGHRPEPTSRDDGLGDAEHDDGRPNEPRRGSQGREIARGTGARGMADAELPRRNGGEGTGVRGDGRTLQTPRSSERGSRPLADGHGAGLREPGEGEAESERDARRDAARPRGPELAHAGHGQPEISEGDDRLDGQRATLGRRELLPAGPRAGRRTRRGDPPAGDSGVIGAPAEDARPDRVPLADADGPRFGEHRGTVAIRPELPTPERAGSHGRAPGELADADGPRASRLPRERGTTPPEQENRPDAPRYRREGGRGELADADRGRREGERLAHRQPEHERAPRRIADRRDGSRARWPARPGEHQHGWEEARLVSFAEQGSTELPVGRAATGVPLRLVRAIAARLGLSDEATRAWWERNKVRLDRRNNRDALRAFGNAIVPQVAEMILRTMDETEESER